MPERAAPTAMAAECLLATSVLPMEATARGSLTRKPPKKASVSTSEYTGSRRSSAIFSSLRGVKAGGATTSRSRPGRALAQPPVSAPNVATP